MFMNNTHVYERKAGDPMAGRSHTRTPGIAAILVLLALLMACGKTAPAQSVAPAVQPQVDVLPPPESAQEPQQTEPMPEPVPEDDAVQPGSAPEEPEEEPEAQSRDDDWKLILVNADHPLPEDYSVTLKELRNDQWVDERIYPELQQMFDDARAEGVYPLINESFRSSERQQEILDAYIGRYLDDGMDEDEARAEALKLVAVPGTSEHQLGLALDIISETDEDDTAAWQWLEENCWRYGFILRYPAERAEITGISYEPWHFRYVGKEAAQEITEQGLTLEEYLGEE